MAILAAARFQGHARPHCRDCPAHIHGRKDDDDAPEIPTAAEKNIYRSRLDLRGSTGPATFLAVWIYCAVTYGFLLGFGLGWIPALIIALLVAVATIFLWPLAAVVVLYVIYRAFVIHPELLTYIALFVGVIAIATVWWWHVVRHNKPR